MLRAYTDQTHKFWGYFQAVTGATVGYSWAATALPPHILAMLAVAYPVFVFLNHRLVVESQTASLDVWRSVQAYVARVGNRVTPEFLPNLALSKPVAPTAVALMHASIGAAATAAIIERYCRAMSA